MKKVHLVIIALLGIAISYSFIKPDQDHDANYPSWTWMSGDVVAGQPAKEKAFKINLGKQFHAGEKLKVTFDNYKVTLGGLAPTITFDKWTGHINLVYLSGNEWLPLRDENDNAVDKVFSGANNKVSDSIKNYSFVITLPESKEIIMTISSKDFEYNNISGNGHPIFTEGRGCATIAVAIKGMEVDKLTK